MNERIKELAEQAEVWANQFEEHWGDGPDTNTLFKEKFAELIVKECSNICDALQDIPATEPRHCAQDILIHFGIEQ